MNSVSLKLGENKMLQGLTLHHTLSTSHISYTFFSYSSLHILNTVVHELTFVDPTSDEVNMELSGSM